MRAHPAPWPRYFRRLSRAAGHRPPMSVVRSNSHANFQMISTCHAACESGANLRVCQRMLTGNTGVTDIVT